MINPSCFFFFQAEDGIRDQPRSSGLGDVYKSKTQLFSVLVLLANSFFLSFFLAGWPVWLTRLADHVFY